MQRKADSSSQPDFAAFPFTELMFLCYDADMVSPILS